MRHYLIIFSGIKSAKFYLQCVSISKKIDLIFCLAKNKHLIVPFLNYITIKASEAYYLDNGKPLPQYDNYALFSSDLLENRENLSTWKGPYLDYLQVQNTRRFHVSKTRFGIEPWTGLYQATILDWPVNSLSGCNIDNANCVEWIAVHADNQAEVNWLNDAFTKLDNYLDKNDGPSKGKIRRIDTSALDQRIYFQSFPRRRTF